MRAIFAIPGALDSPTGGYGYARRVLEGIGAEGIEMTPLALPMPQGDGVEAAAMAGLAGLPADMPVLLDGLAGALLPAAGLAALPNPVAMLCHHPLALEGGLDPADRDRLVKTERAALAQVDWVVTTSHATATQLVGGYGVPHDKLVIAPPGTDPAPRAEGSGSERCHILSVGSLTPRKGHHMLLEALSKVATPAWHLSIAGHAPEADFARALERRAQRLGIADRVSFLGPLDPEELDHAYRGADLFALASAFEGFGMAFAEAVARGLPTLGLSSAAVREATQGAALLVTPKELPAHLDRLVSEPGDRHVLAEAAAATADTLPRWPETVRILAAILRHMA